MMFRPVGAGNTFCLKTGALPRADEWRPVGTEEGYFIALGNKRLYSSRAIPNTPGAGSRFYALPLINFFHPR